MATFGSTVDTGKSVLGSIAKTITDSKTIDTVTGVAQVGGGIWEWTLDSMGGNTANKINAGAKGVNSMRKLLKTYMDKGELDTDGLSELAGEGGQYFIRDFLSEHCSWLPGPVAQAITMALSMAAESLVKEMTLGVKTSLNAPHAEAQVKQAGLHIPQATTSSTLPPRMEVVDVKAATTPATHAFVAPVDKTPELQHTH